jgi:hypothetical protein
MRGFRCVFGHPIADWEGGGITVWRWNARMTSSACSSRSFKLGLRMSWRDAPADPRVQAREGSYEG